MRACVCVCLCYCLLASGCGECYAGRVAHMLPQKETPEHQYFSRRGHRTYAQAAAGCRLSFKPSFDLGMQLSTKYLMHLATNGNAHCLAVDVVSSESVYIFDRTTRWHVSLDEFQTMFRKSADTRYILSLKFLTQSILRKRTAMIKFQTKPSALLDLQAAGSEEGADEFVLDAEDVYGELESFDSEKDEGTTNVADVLITLFEKQVKSFLEDEYHAHSAPSDLGEGDNLKTVCANMCGRIILLKSSGWPAELSS